MDSPTTEELTSEKSLWSVWLLSRKARGRNRIAYIATSAATGFLVGADSWFSHLSTSEVAARVQAWVADGFNLSVAILGFLLAGFTLFPTMMKPSLAIALAQHVHPTSGISYLKHNLAVFMAVFVEYWLLLCTHLLVRFFGDKAGVLASAIRGLPTSRFLVCVAACLVAMQLTHAVLALQSFIFNVYHVVMSGVRWDAEAETSATDQRGPPGEDN
jgi:hypothetical protein